MDAPLAARKKLGRRVLAHGGRTLGYALLFLVFVVVSAVAHLDVPVARRLVAKQVSDGLASLFEGRIVLEHVDDLAASGIRGADAYVSAPDGTKVIVAHGLRAKIAPLALLRAVLAGRGVIRVFDIEIDDAEIVLDLDPKGGPKIGRAFLLANPPPSSPSDGKPPPISVDLASVHVKHTWLHGRIPGAPVLDFDADDVRGSVQISDSVHVGVSHVDLRTRAIPMNANALGVVKDGYVHVARTGIELGGKFDGTIGQAPAHVTVDMDGPEWRATVDVPQLDASLVRAMIPEAPLYGPLAAHAEAKGPLDALAVRANASVGPATVDATALVAVASGVVVKGHVDAADVDLRSFAKEAPASRLATSADVEVQARSGEPVHGTFALTTKEGAIAKEMIPATELRGTFAQESTRGAGGPGITATATGKVLEPGAPTDVTVTLRKGDAAPVLDVQAHTMVPSLGGVRRIGSIGAGQANVTTVGSVTLAPTPRFDANVRAEVDRFAKGDLHVGHAVVAGRAAGTFTAPAFEATIDATDVHEARFVWNKVSATASGSPASIGITVSAHGVETPNIEGHATVATGSVTTITGADLTLRRRTTGMHARIGSVRIGPGLLTMEDAEMTGVGDPLRGSLVDQSGVLVVKAQSTGLDLGQVAYLFRVEDRLKSGRAAFALDLHVAPAHAEGTANLAITDLAYGSDYQAVAISADATLKGRDIEGSGSASMPRLGEVHLTYATVHVGGTGPLRQASWRSSWGDVALDGHVDIANLATLLPAGTLPKWTLGGTMDIKAHTSRASATDEAPLVALSLSTRGLRVGSVPQWELRGVDGTLDVNVKGGAGQVALSAADALGPIASVDAKGTDLAYRELFGADPVSALLSQPMTAHLHVLPRELATLPQLFRPSTVRGFVQLDATATGTALSPVITLDGAARGTTFLELPNVKPLDIETHGSYAAKAGDLTLDVSDAQEVFVHTTAHAKADLGLYAQGKTDPGWVGTMHTTLLHFPLSAVAQLSDRNVRGRVSGDLELTGYHDDAHATATLTTDRFAIGRTRFTKAGLEATYDGQAVNAHTRLESKDGSAEATGKMAMTWGRELVPRPTPLSGLSLAVTAKKLQAAFLEPLLSSTVDELDGVIDGDARVELALGEKPSMSGNVALSDGRVIPSATGEELHGITAKVALAQDGTLSMMDLTALGTSGKVTGTGTAHLAGLSLTDAAVKLSIAKKDAMPLSLGGSVLGTGYGNLTLSARSGSASTKVAIDIPDFHVELPEATPRSVQDLEPPPENIHVGVKMPNGETRTIGKTRDQIVHKKAGENALEIAIHLGQVEVNRGADLRATLGGEATMNITDKNTMRGQIAIKSGRLSVQGKPFEVQKGTATFVGDPQNPEINLTASWKAADGTEVFADYIGPLKTGKVVLRSEPPRPQNEIISLILFGTSDGAQSTPYAQQQQQTDTTTAVGSAASGFATGGLNKGIDKLTGMEISTKIDTSQANPRPEVELQIARDLSLQIAFVLGTPPPGTNQDTTYATIDWRFFHNWSLATTFGNLGSSIADVLWRYRY